MDIKKLSIQEIANLLFETPVKIKNTQSRWYANGKQVPLYIFGFDFYYLKNKKIPLVLLTTKIGHGASIRVKLEDIENF